MSQKELFSTVRALGLTIAKTPYGEYRINVKGGRESTAYYATDWQDALQTAEAIHKHTVNYTV